MTRFWLSQRHSGSLIGAWWVILQPLALSAFYTLIFTLVFPSKFAVPSEQDVPYLLYLLAGLVPWMTFAAVLTSSPTAITGSASLVKNFSFPLEFFAARDVLVALFTWIVGISFVCVIALLERQATYEIWLLIPVLLFVQSLAMFGWALTFSAVGVFLRDLGQIVAIVAMPVVFAMPVFYSTSAAPDFFRPLIFLNPFTYMVLCYQDVFVFGSFSHPWAWLVFGVFSIASFALGVRIFSRSSYLFASAL